MDSRSPQKRRSSNQSIATPLMPRKIATRLGNCIECSKLETVLLQKDEIIDELRSLLAEEKNKLNTEIAVKKRLKEIVTAKSQELKNQELEIQQLKKSLADHTKDKNYAPESKLETLLQFTKQGFALQYRPLLPFISLQLLVDNLMPANAVSSMLNIFQVNFNLWEGLSIPSERWFQTLRDRIWYLNKQHSIAFVNSGESFCLWLDGSPSVKGIGTYAFGISNELGNSHLLCCFLDSYQPDPPFSTKSDKIVKHIMEFMLNLLGNEQMTVFASKVEGFSSDMCYSQQCINKCLGNSLDEYHRRERDVFPCAMHAAALAESRSIDCQDTNVRQVLDIIHRVLGVGNFGYQPDSIKEVWSKACADNAVLQGQFFQKKGNRWSYDARNSRTAVLNWELLQDVLKQCNASQQAKKLRALLKDDKIFLALGNVAMTWIIIGSFWKLAAKRQTKGEFFDLMTKMNCLKEDAKKSNSNIVDQIEILADGNESNLALLKCYREFLGKLTESQKNVAVVSLNQTIEKTILKLLERMFMADGIPKVKAGESNKMFISTNVVGERAFSMFKHVENRFPTMRILLVSEMTKARFNNLSSTLTVESVGIAVEESSTFRSYCTDELDFNLNLRVEAQEKKHKKVCLKQKIYFLIYNVKNKYLNIL